MNNTCHRIILGGTKLNEIHPLVQLLNSYCKSALYMYIRIFRRRSSVATSPWNAASPFSFSISNNSDSDNCFIGKANGKVIRHLNRYSKTDPWIRVPYYFRVFQAPEHDSGRAYVKVFEKMIETSRDCVRGI